MSSLICLFFDLFLLVNLYILLIEFLSYIIWFGDSAVALLIPTSLWTFKAFDVFVVFMGHFLFKIIEICVVEIFILLDVIGVILSCCGKLFSSQEELGLRVLDIHNGINI